MDLQRVKLRVLVVEDHEQLCQYLRRYLMALGCQVVTASSLEKGRAELVTEQYDVLVVDMQLPDGDGVSLLEEALNGGRHVITMSGLDREAGFTASSSRHWHLHKPFRGEQLEGMLREVQQNLHHREGDGI